MKTKVLFLGLVIASMASANAQTFNKNNYAFEVGKMAANLSVKSSCNWWLQESMLKTGWVKPGKWVQVKSEPFHLDGNKEIDMLKAPLHINVPKGTEPVVFYIDDITFEKVD